MSHLPGSTAELIGTMHRRLLSVEEAINKLTATLPTAKERRQHALLQAAAVIYATGVSERLSIMNARTLLQIIEESEETT